jgi:starch synthase
MKILMATSELSPLANTGQLGDEVQILAKELKDLGHEVSVVVPYYRAIRESKLETKSTGIEFKTSFGGKKVSAEVLEAKGPDQIPVFLIRRDEYFDRTGIYAGDGRSYEDNAERFIFFSKATVELAQQLHSVPEVIHCHDWPTALIPVFVRDRELPFKTVLTIHNLEHQGSFWSFDFGLTGLPGSYYGADGIEFYGRVNFLKGGILYADAVTLPGETALFQAFTPKYGFGLDGVITGQADHFFGIPHGVDYTPLWVEREKSAGKRVKNEKLETKKAARFLLLEELGLSSGIEGPLFVLPLEEGDEEAFDGAFSILDLLLSDDTGLIVAGPIPESGIGAVIVAERKYPLRFAVMQNGKEKLGPSALSASDIVLLPSSLGFRGVTACAGLKSGTIPIVRDRAGIRQIVSDFDPASATGNGFIYDPICKGALWDTIQRAKQCYRQPATWSKLVERAKALDFSWKQSAKSFAKLYLSLLRHKSA